MFLRRAINNRKHKIIEYNAKPAEKDKGKWKSQLNSTKPIFSNNE